MTTPDGRTRPALIDVLVPSVLLLLLVGLVAAILVLGVFDDAGDDDAGALAVAREETINFFDLDHRRIDDDIDQVLSLATGDFASEYADKRDVLTTSVQDAKAVWTASIPEDGAAVEYLEEDGAAVLVAVDVEKAIGDAAPASERNRVRLVLEKVDGSWRVADFQEVG